MATGTMTMLCGSLLTCSGSRALHWLEPPLWWPSTPSFQRWLPGALTQPMPPSSGNLPLLPPKNCGGLRPGRTGDPLRSGQLPLLQTGRCSRYTPAPPRPHPVRHLCIDLPHRSHPPGKRADHQAGTVHLLHRLHPGLPGGCPQLWRTGLCHWKQTLCPQMRCTPSARIFPVILRFLSDTLLEKRRDSDAFLLQFEVFVHFPLLSI